LQDKILAADCTQLREYLNEGTVTSVQLVNFFGKRSYSIGRKLSLSTEELFNEALEQASNCDKERVEARKSGTLDQLPFLFGIPMSVKEQFGLKGYYSTVGCAFNNKRRMETSPALIPLMNAGAIFLVRGNLP